MSITVLDKCYGCGLCTFSCPRGAIVALGGSSIRFTVDPIACNDCMRCINLCPVDALVSDPAFAVCKDRGCPMTSSRFAEWQCSEGAKVCDRCKAILWRPPQDTQYRCPRCDLKLRVICPKNRTLEARSAA